jgi:hypothetical protein
MRIIGIYHTKVYISGRFEPLIVDFLHIRQLARDESCNTSKRLPCIGFLSLDDDRAFGFLDPTDVVRAVHLMPAFAWGYDNEDVPGHDSLAYQGDEEDKGWDWMRLYVNMYIYQ